MSVSRIDFVRAIVACDPNNVPAMIEMGWLYELEQHDFDAAIGCINRGIAQCPGAPDAYFWLAKLYYHDGAQFEEAKGALETALRCDPRHVPSLSLLASVLSDLHQTGEAISLLEKAVEIEPSWVLLHAKLDHVYTRMDDMESAIRSARRALRLAEQFHAVSTAETYSYYESAVTGRWVNDQDIMDELKRRAARTP